MHDASESLVEPASDAVEAVVQVTSRSIPVLPCRGGAIVDHVQIARVGAFLEHAIDIVGLPFTGCPFRQDRHTDKTDSEVASVDGFSALEELRLDLSDDFSGNSSDQHRIDHVELGSGPIDIFLRMIEGFVNQPVQFFLPGGEFLRIGFLAEQ